MHDRKPWTLLLAILLPALLFAASPVRAQEPQPGEACPETDRFMRVSGPENPGSGHFLFCDSNLVWKPVMRFQSAGHVLFNSGGTPAAPLHVWGEAIIGSNGLACDSATEGAIRYDSAGQAIDFCDGSSWSALGSGGGALNDLTDVDTTGFADGDVLMYSAGASAWVPVEMKGFRGAVVKLDSTQTLPTSSFTTISWDSEIYDTDDFWDAGSPTRLTVPAGVTHVRISTNIFADSSSQLRIRIYKNGAASDGVQAMETDTSGLDAVNGSSAVLEVTAGDYFEVAAYVSSDINAHANTWFAIEVVKAYTISTGGTTVNTLSDVGDVTISGASSGEVLTWNGSNWLNQAGGGLWTTGAGDDIYYNSGTPMVGIGTESPQAPLEVAGEIKFSSSGLACGAAQEGAVRYNSSGTPPWEYCDGGMWSPLLNASFSVDYDISVFMPGIPLPNAIIRIVLPRAVRLPQNLPSSQCDAQSAANDAASVTISKSSGGSSVAIGTADWAASDTTCSFSFSADTDFAAGDVLEFTFPGTPDSSLADIAITLVGNTL